MGERVVEPEVRTLPAARVTVPGLLLCGVLTGPVSMAVVLVLGSTRPGYDQLRQPVSSLALGPGGWMMVATFLLGGALMLAFAAGLARALRALGRASRWAPPLVAGWAVALLGAGVFPTDPISGYPVDEPVHRGHTVHGVLHAVPFSVSLVAALIAVCAVFARRFVAEGRPGWAAYSVLTAALVLTGFCLFGLVFTLGEGPAAVAGLLQLLTITVGWGWLSLLALDLRRQLRAASRP